MVSRLTAWNEITQVGNPAQLVEVNNLIKRVKKKEVPKQGKSSARCALEPAEFVSTLSMLNQSRDIKRKYMVPTSAKFQFHMVGQLNDICHFEEVAEFEAKPTISLHALRQDVLVQKCYEEKECT